MSPGSPLGVVLWSPPQAPVLGSGHPRARLGHWLGQADQEALRPGLSGPAGTGLPPAALSLWEEPTGPFLAGRSGALGDGAGTGPWASGSPIVPRSSPDLNGCPQAPAEWARQLERRNQMLQSSRERPAASPARAPYPARRGPASGLSALPAAA